MYETVCHPQAAARMGVAAAVLQGIGLSVCCGLVCRWRGHYTAASNKPLCDAIKDDGTDGDSDEEASLKS